MTRSSNITVDRQHLEACRQACFDLMNEISAFARKHAYEYGLRAPVVIVLAGTSMCAALAISRRNKPEDMLWNYEHRAGRLYVHGSNSHVYVCEDPTLPQWSVRITAPGDATLGRALIHEATINTHAVINNG
jgi:hypothetical protein